MDAVTWMSAVTDGDSINAVANRTGMIQTTLNRQVRGGALTPETVVAIARAYGAPVLPGLVACGLITEAEAALKERASEVEEVLATATDRQIINSVLARLAGGAELHAMLTAPLDERHPAMRPDASE